METRHLRYFLAVMDHGSVSRAAEWLGIAQPALSQALGRMERTWACACSSVRAWAPRPRRRRWPSSRRARQRGPHRRRRAARREIARGSAGQLTVGLVTSALFDTLPRALRELRRQAPGVKVVLREMSNAEQAQALQDGGIDIGLMHTPVAVGGRMRERQLLRERLVAAVPDEFELDPDGQTSLARIAQAGLVMYPQAQLPSFYADILDALRKAGHDAHVAQEANRTLTVLSCVAGGCGVALLPSWIRSMDFSGVRFCEVRDGQSLPSFDLSAIWPARSVPTLADLFANLDLRPAGAAQT